MASLCSLERVIRLRVRKAVHDMYPPTEYFSTLMRRLSES